MISFFAGFLLAALVFGFWVLPYYHHDGIDVGRKQGEISTEMALINKVIDQLGDDYRRADGYPPFAATPSTPAPTAPSSTAYPADSHFHSWFLQS